MLDKSTAARISAYWNSWDEQSFAEHAKKGLVYRQKFDIATVFGYVIGKDDDEFPIHQLIDVNSTPNLLIVLPIDAVNLRILSLVSFIETARQMPQQRTGVNEGAMSAIDIVGEVGKNARGSKYECAEFTSSNQLEERVHEILVATLGEEQKKRPPVELVKFSDEEFNNAIRGILRPFTKHQSFQIVNGSVVVIEEPED